MSDQDGVGVTAADLRFHVSSPVQWFDRDERIVPQGTTLLTGRPKSGKSLLCEQVAVEMAERWSVAYFAFEYGTNLMKDRFKRHVQVDIDYRGLRLFSRDDVPARERPLSFVQRVLSDAKAAGRGYDVAFIDVLNKVKPRTDGSYDREYDAVVPVTELAPNQVKALVVVHHTRKRDLKASAGQTGTVDETLGSTALVGAFDTIVGLTRKEGLITLNHESRLFESRRCGLRLADGKLRFSSQSDIVAAELIDLAPLQARIVQFLAQRKVTRAELAVELDVEVSSISRAVTSLRNREIVLPSGRGEVLQLAD